MKTITAKAIDDYLLSMTYVDKTCEVCNRPDRDLAGVYSSTMGPISFAICKECVLNGAEPHWIIEGVIIECGGKQNMRPGWFEGVNFYSSADGRYHSADEVEVTEQRIKEFWECYGKAYKEAMAKDLARDK